VLPSLTPSSVAQTLSPERCASSLSSTFHRRLPWLLLRGANIEGVKPLADLPPATRTAAALVAAVGLALTASACGGSAGSNVAQLGLTTTQSIASSDASAGSAQGAGWLAFSRCMRANGVPNYPDPDGSGKPPKKSLQQLGVNNSQFQSAVGACRHLLPNGGTGTPQQRQQKFAFALKVARCLRRHGYPTYPDPTASGQQHPGIDTHSPRFRAAEKICERRARKALGPP
jgi:hypothetical protein